MSAERLARAAWSEPSAVGALLRTALLPASALFRAGSAAHHALYDAGLRRAERAPMPVISVGNLRVGGAGKTPFTGWLVDRLLELGRAPAVLHGGYGSDEPELHRRWHPAVPVFTGRDRVASTRSARTRGCDVAVLDDGFQHRRLARDLDVVLLAAEHGAERIRLLPRGPWREPLSALERADVAVVTRKTASAEQAEALAARIESSTGLRAVRAWLRPDGWTLPAVPAAAPGDPGTPTGAGGGAAGAPGAPSEAAVALAGIAEPESFFATLEALRVPLAARLAFPDHHVYSPADLERIVRTARGRPIVTTAKDAVRLGALAGVADVRVLEQRVTIEQGEAELVERIAGAVA